MAAGEENLEPQTEPVTDDWEWQITLNDFMFTGTEDILEIELLNPTQAIDEKETAEFSFKQTTNVNEKQLVIELTTFEVEDFAVIYDEPEAFDFRDIVVNFCRNFN